MPAVDPRLEALAGLQEAALGNAAMDIAGFEFGGDAEFASAATVAGLRAGTLVFSRRHDSLTIFATDARYGSGAELGTWTGPDDELLTRAAATLDAAGVPRAEIARSWVSPEFGATAQRVSDEEFRVEESELLRKTAVFGRALDGTPVWSSYAQIELTAEGRIGRLEIHWPVVPPPVAEEARLLAALAYRGWKPPEAPEARVESVEAGVLHSPAVGFFADAVAALRVTYRSVDQDIGRKPVRYLDRHGEPVPAPRDIPRVDPKSTVEREPGRR
ncbi:hypothetical protein BJ973_004056 [Actinoplanes tereljensis]|uniref:Uncharacterized protein n=1 Tax=Paractinoplanes tereljensis TaxID=571912 RepID=A0A919NSH1_9ACTN|nr:hypothetical protein [Actinoplanes tereljensis]GIF23445.1 hypothetical protein Ate02nite_61750 [Actinoplanes tereljensis]